MAIKILTVLFALIAVRRVVVRYRRRGGLTLEFILWLMVFSGIAVVVFIPHKTDQFAHWLGVSSGFNALTFIAITGLLYAVYRLLSRLQVVERDVTRLVRALALQQPIAVRKADTAPPPPPSLPPVAG
jgi:small membrane protein